MLTKNFQHPQGIAGLVYNLNFKTQGDDDSYRGAGVGIAGDRGYLASGFACVECKGAIR